MAIVFKIDMVMLKMEPHMTSIRLILSRRGILSFHTKMTGNKAHVRSEKVEHAAERRE